MANEIKLMGITVKSPDKECEDPKCPFHGSLSIRGRNLTGHVVAKDIHRSATVEITSKKFVSKYERFTTRRTKIRVHNPPCINAQVGEQVMIFETRPISKTKHFVIVQNYGLSEEFIQKKQRIEDDSKQSKKFQENAEKVTGKESDKE